MGVKFGTEEGTVQRVALPGENPQNQPPSKLNNRHFALRAMLPVNKLQQTTNHKTRCIQRWQTSHPVPPPNNLDQKKFDVRLVLPAGKLDETHIVFHSGLFPPLYENVKLSTKTQVHNVSYCRQRKTEQWQHVTCTENLMKLGRVFLRQTNRHTNKYTATVITRLCNPTEANVTKSLLKPVIQKSEQHYM